MCVCPVVSGKVCFVLVVDAQFWTTGLVLSGDRRDLVRDRGSGLFSCDSHDETRHFLRLTNVLIVLIKYTSAATAVRDIPVKVRKSTNHICDSVVNSWKCFSVDIVINPLHPSIAVSRASCQTTLPLCPHCQL